MPAKFLPDIDYALDFETELKFVAGDPEGTIEGYASKFGVLDQVGDIVMPGAFKSSLAGINKRGGRIPMLSNHNPYTPIGAWYDMSEDDKGLKVKGKFTLGVQLANETHLLVKDGAIQGLSIGFRTINADISKTTPGARELKTIDLKEISPVAFPALREAAILNVKSEHAFDLAFDVKQIERALREGGLSNRDAKIGVRVFKQMAFRDGSQPEPDSREADLDALSSMTMSVRAALHRLQTAA